MKDIVHIVGNRPQFIKLAVLHDALHATGRFRQTIVHTGQHSSHEMSGIFFSDLKIPSPDLQLDPTNANHPDAFIAGVTMALQEYLARLRDQTIVMVYGDTNTTLAAAIAAARTGHTLVHFEAGIRTGDNSMPEEINRVLTDRLAGVNYCCTELNYTQLTSEGFGSAITGRVVHTGDLMLDAFLRIPARPFVTVPAPQYVLCTIHRAANILSRLKLHTIVTALNEINADCPIVMPLHPHTQKRIAEYALQPAFHIIDPVGYPVMKQLMMQADSVITDSGGAAREAFFCGKRSTIIMDKPFWPEIIDAQVSIQCPAGVEAITQAWRGLPSLTGNFNEPIFGDGKAAQRIAADLLHC